MAHRGKFQPAEAMPFLRSFSLVSSFFVVSLLSLGFYFVVLNSLAFCFAQPFALFYNRREGIRNTSGFSAARASRARLGSLVL